MKKKNYLGIEVESSVIGWEEAQKLPFPGEGELELVAGLAVQYLYQNLGEKGFRPPFDAVVFYAWQVGYRIPKDKFPEFLELCKAKWRLIIQYLETEYQLR